MGSFSDRGALSPGEAAEYLGTSRKNLYVMLNRGDIASAKIGHRRFIRREELDRLLRERESRTVRGETKKSNGGAAA